MIDTTHRFQGYGSLRFVYQKGRTIRGPSCSLKYVLNRRRDTFRAAVVVSRKVHKSAVVRNRIRRRIYEVIRTAAPTIIAPFDLVFIVYSDQLADVPAAQLKSAVYEKLEKAGILQPKGVAGPTRRDIVKLKEN